MKSKGAFYKWFWMFQSSANLQDTNAVEQTIDTLIVSKNLEIYEP